MFGENFNKIWKNLGKNDKIFVKIMTKIAGFDCFFLLGFLEIRYIRGASPAKPNTDAYF